MAKYTNTVPPNLKDGDVLYFDKGGSFVIPRGEYKVTTASGQGGYGGGINAFVQKYPGTSGANGSDFRTIGVDGAAGGSGIACVTTIKCNDVSNSIVLGVGRAGAAGGGTASMLSPGVSGEMYDEGGGKAGGGSSFSLNGAQIVGVSGGGGASGATLYLGPLIGGEIGGGGGWTCQYSATKGRTGSTGVVSSAPVGYTTFENKMTSMLQSAAGYIQIEAISLNSPPSTPKNIKYDTPLSGRPLEITWEKSTDPEGDEITYIVEQKVDGGGWITSGTTKFIKLDVTAPASGNAVTYRVKAVDEHGAESGYATGSAKTIVYNFPPTISGVDEDRGVIKSAFEYLFSVDDQDLGDVISVEVYLDDKSKTLLKIDDAERNKSYTVDLNDEWLYTSMTTHKIIIEAKDDKGGSAKRTITFSKHSNQMKLKLKDPIKFSELVVTLMLFFNYKKNSDATVLIEVQNDPAAGKEDVTAFNHESELYEFVNDQKTTMGDAEFMAWITITKGASGGEIEFSGASFVFNANGIELSTATGVRTNPNVYPPTGVLKDEDNVQSALNALSIAASLVGLQISEKFNSLADLKAKYPVGITGKIYAVSVAGSDVDHGYIWNANTNSYASLGPIVGPGGIAGKDGVSGLDGKDGKNAEFAGYYDTLLELETEIPAGVTGKLYIIGEDLEIAYWAYDAGKYEIAGSIRGAQGKEGVAGDKIHILNTAPTPGLGENGDIAIDWGDSGIALYEKYDDGTWNKKGDLRGGKGDTGKAFTILGTKASIEILKQDVPNPEQGDVYNVGINPPYTAYMFDNGDWLSQGNLQGDSAYVVWLSAGNTGTVEDYLASLKGEKGDDSGSKRIVSNSFTILQTDWKEESGLFEYKYDNTAILEDHEPTFNINIATMANMAAGIAVESFNAYLLFQTTAKPEDDLIGALYIQKVVAL